MPASIIPVSDRKLQANRANAQHSTGPLTEQGKSVSRENARTHGIFSRNTILPGEDAQLFHAHRIAMLRRLNPRDQLELMLADQIIAASWRLGRVAAAEREEHRRIIDAMVKERKSKVAYCSKREAARMLAEMPPITAEVVLRELIRSGFSDCLREYETRFESQIARGLKELRVLQSETPAELTEFTAELIADAPIPVSEPLIRTEERVEEETRPQSSKTRAKEGLN